MIPIPYSPFKAFSRSLERSLIDSKLGYPSAWSNWFISMNQNIACFLSISSSNPWREKEAEFLKELNYLGKGIWTIQVTPHFLLVVPVEGIWSRICNNIVKSQLEAYQEAPSPVRQWTDRLLLFLHLPNYKPAPNAYQTGWWSYFIQREAHPHQWAGKLRPALSTPVFK